MRIMCKIKSIEKIKQLYYNGGGISCAHRRKMMKKLLLMLALVISMVAATACGAKTDDAGESFNNMNSEKESKEDKKEPIRWEFKWSVPEGFLSEDGELYVTDDYPTDTSNITYTHSENDSMGINFTSKKFEELMDDTFSKLVIEIDVVVDKFEEIEKSGCKGLSIESHYSMGEVELIQIQYVFQLGEEIHTVCYTAVGDTWLDKFVESAKSITITPIYE